MTIIWNVYRSRLVAHYWQQQGLTVIPTLQWAEPRTFEFCFDGIPKNGTVAVSTLGAAKHKVSKEIWKIGMKEAIRRIHPKTILLYGRPIDFDFGDIEVVSYANETTERMAPISIDYTQLQKQYRNILKGDQVSCQMFLYVLVRKRSKNTKKLNTKRL